MIKSLLIKNLLRIGLEKGLKAKKPQFTGLKIIAVLLILIALIFALIAGHQILRVEYGLINANLYFAAGFAVSALLVLLVLAIKKSRANSSKFDSKNDGTFQAIKAPIEEKAELASLQVQRGIANNTGKALLGAVVLGLFLGAKSRK